MAIAVVADNVRIVSPDDFSRIRVVSNATITAGDVVFHDGTGLEVADDDASTESANCIGVALQGGSSGDMLDVITQGELTGWTGLTAGAICYVVDDGKVAHTAGTKTFAVGWAVSTTNIYVNPNATVA